jgi:hypothetical protein
MPAIHRVIPRILIEAGALTGALMDAEGWMSGFKGIVHPLTDELGGLVENDQRDPHSSEFEPDTSWRWMTAIAVVIGLFAWFTR